MMGFFVFGRDPRAGHRQERREAKRSEARPTRFAPASLHHHRAQQWSMATGTDVVQSVQYIVQFSDVQSAVCTVRRTVNSRAWSPCRQTQRKPSSRIATGGFQRSIGRYCDEVYPYSNVLMGFFRRLSTRSCLQDSNPKIP